MSNQNQISSLEEMTNESFLNRPEQAVEAIEEYLGNLQEESAQKNQALKLKLKNDPKYLEQFKIAITHTSLMVFLMSLKSANPEEVPGFDTSLDFDQYVREFLFFARQDDRDIYDMRLFYLNGLTAEELGLDQVNEAAFKFDDQSEYDSEKEAKEALATAKASAKQKFQKYEQLRQTFKKQYCDSKVHLVV